MGVRWDAVVEPTRAQPVQALPQPSGSDAADGVRAQVRLFGGLAAMNPQRSLLIELAAGATMGDVLTALSAELVPAAMGLIVDDSGAKRRSCRIFLNGGAADDMHLPLQAEGDPAQVDIILLVSPEGG